VKDRETLPTWLREAADELEKAHRILDDLGAPEASPDGTPLSLAARIGAQLAPQRWATGIEVFDYGLGPAARYDTWRDRLRRWLGR
jgi:hypothetical protein